MSDTELVPHNGAITFDREQVELIKRTICQGATDDELSLFIQTSGRLKLDPFARQVFAVKRWDKKAGREIMSIQVSIDGFRLVAERTGRYAGQLGPYWTKDGKEWLEVWLSKDPPAAAKVAVIRSDFREPLWGVATWEQYKQEGREGLTPMWRRMGPLMLAKCAESLALRRAFPNELSGVYTAEEMAQATTDSAAPPVYVPPPAPVGPTGWVPSPAPVGPNVPVPNKNGRGAWPKAVSEHHTVTATREIDEAYARTVNDGAAPSDLEVQLQRSIDNVTVEVIDHVTGEVSKQPKATAAQLKKLHAMVGQLKIDDKAYRAGLKKYYGVTTSKLLTKAQCSDMVERLEITRARVPADMLPAEEMDTDDKGDVPEEWKE